MGKLLRVDLSRGRVTPEPIRSDWARQFAGGAGLATRYLYDEVPPGDDPFGAANRLIFMAGPLTGTASASASHRRRHVENFFCGEKLALISLLA